MCGARVYLAQTDTTVGFVGPDAAALARAKGRSASRPMLKALPEMRAISDLGRVPFVHRRRVRRAKASSFILPNGRSFRVVVDGPHRELVARLGGCYTTSANRHGEGFDEAYAREAADVWVETAEGYRQKPPSAIWRLGRKKAVRVR